MSKLSFRIRQLNHDLNDGKRNIFVRIYYFLVELWYEHPHVWIFRVKSFFSNLRFFWKHILQYRDWDSWYTIDLLCDSLGRLAKGLKDGNHTKAEKCYRRCKTAEGMLRHAYDQEAVFADKSYKYLIKKNPFKFIHDEKHSQLTHEWGNTKEYYDKMYVVVRKRLDGWENQRKKEAWAYIHKYIEHFWE